MYIIKRIDQGGGFLADQRKRAGGSYTRNIQNARTFHTKKEAEAECCPENEIAIPLEEQLCRPR